MSLLGNRVHLRFHRWIYFGVLLGFLLFFGVPPLWLLIKGGLGPLELTFVQIFPSVVNTLLVVIGVAVLTLLLGFSTSYCLNNFIVFGGPFLRIALLWPLAFPAYVMAFVYLGISGSGVYSLQGNILGLIWVLGLSLFPYVYIFSSLAMSSLRGEDWEAHQMLREGEFGYFKKILIPQVRPFVIAGLLLVVMETFADFGAASVINVPVFTTLIYKVWFGYFSFSGAVVLASHYLIFLSCLLFLEAKFKPQTRWVVGKDLPLRTLTPSYTLFMSFWLWSVFGVSFLWPTFQLLVWLPEGVSQWGWHLSYQAMVNTMGLGLGCAFLILSVNLGLLGWVRFLKVKLGRLWEGLFSLGYSLPGTLLSVAFVALISQVSGGVLLMASLLPLILALGYKFFPVGHRTLVRSYQGVPKSLDEYSETTGRSFWYLFYRGHWPLLRISWCSAFLLVAIEIFKEMPMTLMLAPSGFETLSIQIFNFTSEGEWEKAAVPGFFLIMTGAVSTFLIARRYGVRV